MVIYMCSCVVDVREVLPAGEGEIRLWHTDIHIDVLTDISVGV